MSKLKNRICGTCADVLHQTATRSQHCSVCAKDKQKSLKIEQEKLQVAACYGNANGPSINKFGKRCYTFTHSCGTTQTWRFDNLLSCWKRGSPEPCKSCGGKKRMAIALDGYIKKFNLDERAKTELSAYTSKVRGLSEAVYRNNISIINPNHHTRSQECWHLDHKIPIVECFMRGWTPSEAAHISNLQMLPAAENLKKGRKIIE